MDPKDDGPKDLMKLLTFKQPRSRRGRASVRKRQPQPNPPATAAVSTEKVVPIEKLKKGDIFKGWYGPQVVLNIAPVNGTGLMAVTYRRVRKDGSLVMAGNPGETSIKRGSPTVVHGHIDVSGYAAGDNTGASPEKESITMATVTRKGGAKGGNKGKGKGKAAPAKSNGTRRSAADVRALVPQFVKHLKDGGTMRDLKQEHGFSDDGPIRAALYHEGFDSKGAKHGEEAGDIDASKAAGKKELVKLRTAGAGWYVLAYRAGITEAEAKKIIADAGGPTGRVYTKSDKPAKAAGKSSGKGAKAKAKAADEDPS